MTKYKYANKEHTSVNDVEYGIYNIHPGVYLWSDVEKYVNSGGVIEPFKTEQEIKKEATQKKINELLEIKRVYKDETGIIIDGVKFDTDLKARVAYSELRLKFSTNPDYYTPNWKASDGNWVTMNLTLFNKVISVLEQRLESIFTFVKNKEEEILTSPNPSSLDLTYNG